MLNVRPIDDLNLPELAPYRTMRRQQDHRARGIFVAEGEKIVRRLLDTNLEIVSLLLPPKWFEEYRSTLEQRPEPRIDVFTGEKALLEELTGFSMYQGVLGVARVPPPITLDQAVQHSDGPPLIVAVDAVCSAENLGGLVRNCAAFGSTALLVGETSCSPYLRRAVRGSMGTIFKLPVIDSENLVRSLAEAKTLGLRAIAAHPHTDEQILSNCDLTGGCVIVLGSEGDGISQRVLDECDSHVVIPMRNAVDSLNVGTAGAVFLYEAARQRERLRTSGL